MKIIFIFSCSGMFRNVPACSGMFRVPGFIDGRLIYESVNIFFLMLSRLQGYPSIEHLYLADSSLARVGS